MAIVLPRVELERHFKRLQYFPAMVDHRGSNLDDRVSLRIGSGSYEIDEDEAIMLAQLPQLST
jgi:hypothetical protein